VAATSHLTSGSLGGIFGHRSLIAQLTEREIIGRYRGSLLGLLWPFVTPLLMLALYTFVFGVIFGARRSGVGGEVAGIGEFAIVLFAGLTLHGVLAETLSQCPRLILSNHNYVKRVVFPLQILPVVTLGGALFHALISFVTLLAVQFAITGRLPLTFLLLPVVVAPFAVLALGIGWFLASIGVYLRDIDQILRPVTTALLFLSPIVYPLAAIPERLQPLLYLNPLTFIVEETRAVLIWGQTPNWLGLAIYASIALIIAALGLWWFQKTRKGFADVL
jgi:lipopolysaccharide transport system permease protein